MKKLASQYKEFKQRNRSLRYKWTRSFIVILIVPMIVNYGFYLYFMSSVRDEVDAKNQAFYETVVREVNINIQKYNKIGADLGINALVRQVSNIQAQSEITGEVAEELKNALYRYYIDLYSAYRNFVYFDENDVILTTDGIEDADEYLETRLGSIGLTVGEWKRWLEGHGNETLAFQGPENVKGLRPRYVAIRYTIFENRSVRPTNMVIVLEEAALIRVAQNLLDGEAFYLDVQNEKGELIASNFVGDLNRDRVSRYIKDKQGNFQIREKGRRFNVSHILSDTNAWRYIFYTPENVYYSKVRTLNLVFFGSMLFILLAGLVLIREIIGKQYAPVAKILQQLPGRSGSGGDEYLEIENMVLDSIRNKRENTLIVEKQKKSQTDHLIRMMLSGQISVDEKAQALMRDLPIDFEKGYTAVVIFSMNHYTDLFEDEKISDYERYGILIDIIENIGGELFDNRRMASYFVENNGNLLCLVNYRDEADCEVLLDLLGEILRHIEKYFGTRLAACAGRGYRSGNVAESFREALYCMDYISYEHGENVVYYEDVEKEAGYLRAFGVEEENALNTYIRAGEPEKACALAERYIRQETWPETVHSFRYKYYVNEILSSLLRNFQQYIEENDASVNNIYLLLMVQSVETDRILENFNALIRGICGKITDELSRSADSSAAGELTAKVRAYIDRSYSDPELSSERIAEYCGMSVSYISRIFRKEMDDGVLNYINRTRIQAAKEILKDNSVRIEDAAVRVGLLNTNTFIRLFKKYEGVTPGAYKKAKQVK